LAVQRLKPPGGYVSPSEAAERAYARFPCNGQNSIVADARAAQSTARIVHLAPADRDRQPLPERQEPGSADGVLLIRQAEEVGTEVSGKLGDINRKLSDRIEHHAEKIKKIFRPGVWVSDRGPAL